MRKKVNWIFDADIRGFFDHLSHEWLVKFIEPHRRPKDRSPDSEMVEGGRVPG